jgi:hypothetical protein
MHDEPMRSNEMEVDEAQLDLRVVQALERVPEVRIPVDFASRVAGQVPARSWVGARSLTTTGTIRTTRFGYWAMVASVVVLSVVMLVLAPRTMRTDVVAVALEWTLAAQFIGLVLWLSVRGLRSN